MTPDGATLPFKIVDGVKVFHLIAQPVTPRVRAGLGRRVLGLQRPRPRADDRGGRGRSRADLRDEQAARADDRALARRLRPERDGRRGGRDAARDRAGRDLQLRVPAAPARDVHVPLAPRRDGADGARPDGDVRRPSAEAHRAASRSRLRLPAERVGDRARNAAAGSERDDGLQRPHVQRAGVPGHGAAGRAPGRARSHPDREPERDGPPPDPPSRHALPRSSRPTAA